jgi:hypothetical protein
MYPPNAAEMVRGMARRHVISVGAVALVALGSALAPIATNTTAVAAPNYGPGKWAQLSNGSVGLIDEPSVHRFGSQLQVVWTQNGETQLQTRIVGANGAPSTAATVLNNWATLDEFPSITSSGGQRVIVFSGLQDTNTSNPYTAGYNYYATSPDGVNWSVADGTIGAANSAYGSYGSDATDIGGTPLAVFTASSNSNISYHSGFDSLPPSTPDQTTADNPKCCAYYAGVGYDATNGSAWTAWYSNSGLPTTDGIDAQQIYPTAGPMVHAPSSTSTYAGTISSVAPSQRTLVAARVGGGLYSAYGIGYPVQTKVALWKLGSGSAMVINAHREVMSAGVAAAPGGALWLYWWDKGTSSIHAARTNAAGKVLGAICTVATPNRTTSVWNLTGDASNGLLDLVANAGDGSAEHIYSTQVLPCLSVSVSHATVSAKKGGKVIVTVRDAGVPVSGVQVRYGNTTKKTNAHGQVTFKIAKHGKKGTKTITVRRGGYTAAKATFRIR